jgi:hypothetical protein
MIAERISRVRPQLQAEHSLYLLHDNAPSHFALVAKTFLVSDLSTEDDDENIKKNDC